MQEELHEVRLSATSRGRALRTAQRFVQEESRADNSHAIEEAFAGFEPQQSGPGGETQPQPAAGSPTPRNTRATTAEIALQLKQLEEHRERLTQLLNSLEQAE